MEQLLTLAEETGHSLTRVAMAFATSHADVTAVIIGPRTMDQLDDLLVGATLTLGDDIFDKVDTKSSRPAPTSALWTAPAYLPPSPERTCVDARPTSEPPRENAMTALRGRSHLIHDTHRLREPITAATGCGAAPMIRWIRHRGWLRRSSG